MNSQIQTAKSQQNPKFQIPTPAQRGVRRWDLGFGRLLGFGIWLLGFFPPLAGAQTPSPSKLPPNFVVILADDLGAVELGCYGNKETRTPRLDRLAQEGTRFTTGWVTPLCSPTRVMLMTGQYGFRTGWYSLAGRPGSPGDTISPDLPTFADLLKSRGYATGLAGKWQLGPIDAHPTTILDSGFDEYLMWACQAMPPDAPKGLSPRPRYWHPAHIAMGKYVPTTPDQYGPDLELAWLLDYIRRKKDGPFLAYWPMTLVHAPWEPPPALKGAAGPPSGPGSARARKKTGEALRPCVEYMDHLVGKLLDALDGMGLRETTYVVFIGDNGTGGAGKGTTTERGVRVPLIVAGPGVKKGLVTDALASGADILPTLAEWSGAKSPEGVTIDGVSLAPVLRGEKAGVRDWLFSYLRDERMLRDGRWLLQGDGKFLDCGTSRDGTGYKDVTGSKDPDVLAARKKFDEILSKLPAPAPIADDGAVEGDEGAAPDPAKRKARKRK